MNKINRQLVENFCKNDRRAATMLFEQLRRPLFGYLYRMCRDRFVAEDLLQETLLTIHARIDTYNPDYEFMPWAYTIARNKFLEFKCRQTKVVRISAICLTECDTSTIKPFNEAADLSHDLADVLETLSEPVKEAFVLKHFQGMTFNEIADLQQIPVPTAKSRVLFALKKIRQYIHRSEKS